MAEKFKALVMRGERGGAHSAAIEEISVEDLPKEEVLVRVDYSTVNYKDGLAIANAAPIVQTYPMVGGVDLAGTVAKSDAASFKPGDKVLVNGYGLSERHWGGYSGFQRVKADFLIKIPPPLTPFEAMALGTAGYTAMLAVMALEDGGVLPDKGAVLVSGASGGVGTTAIQLLTALGYRVAASTGSADAHGFLKSLGAGEIVKRGDLEGDPPPLASERWAGAVDSVGGKTLANLLAATQYGGTVAVCGLVGGMDLPTTVLPLILRGARIQGIDSVMAPRVLRQAAWARLAEMRGRLNFTEVVQTRSLEDLPQIADRILKGGVRGRIVIDVNK